ncbi:MAG: GNAT family N-acetyltransferase [Umezawaea sp.]
MKLVTADSLDEAELKRVREIYEDGFPPHLRAPFAELLTDRAFALVDEEPIGFAVLRPLATTGWVFLRFFVAGTRGHGVGSLLWDHLTRAMAETGFTRMVHDVEDPAETHVDPAEIVVRNRRIAFYERNGARLLPVESYLPPHGDEEPHSLRLMAADLNRSPTPPIVGNDLRALVEAVYEHRYGLPATDPVVRRTLVSSGLV